MNRRVRGDRRQRRTGSFVLRLTMALACVVLTRAPIAAAETSPEHQAAVEILTGQRHQTLRTIQWTAVAAAAVVVIGTAALRWSQVVRKDARFRRALRSARLESFETPESVATAVKRLLALGPVEEIRKERERRLPAGGSRQSATRPSNALFEALDSRRAGEPAGSRLLRASALLQSATAGGEDLEPLLRPDPTWTPKEAGRAAGLCRKAWKVHHDEGWPLVYEILARQLAGEAEVIAKLLDEVRGIHLEAAIPDPLRKEFLVCLIENGHWKKARALINHLIRVTENPDVMKREMGWIDVLERSTPMSAHETSASHHT
ncbi:MAG: hypothetical protein IT428_18780 [Planctomycetaceae bacterium]|nr:hypothetical protein [Planctomycetaceae bacterium]